MSDNPEDAVKPELKVENEKVEENISSNPEKDVPGESKERTIENVCDDMLKKVFDYFNGDLTATCRDYELLETLNKMALAKYEEMSKKTNGVTANMSSLNEKYKALQPFLEQIDHLEEGVQKLETAAYQLDDYSKQLEARFKKLDKR